jgi:hypothetical protein
MSHHSLARRTASDSPTVTKHKGKYSDGSVSSNFGAVNKQVWWAYICNACYIIDVRDLICSQVQELQSGQLVQASCKSKEMDRDGSKQALRFKGR